MSGALDAVPRARGPKGPCSHVAAVVGATAVTAVADVVVAGAAATGAGPSPGQHAVHQHHHEAHEGQWVSGDLRSIDSRNGRTIQSVCCHDASLGYVAPFVIKESPTIVNIQICIFSTFIV